MKNYLNVKLFKRHHTSSKFAWPVRTGKSDGVVFLPRTGQLTSYAQGDDGDLQSGAAWPIPRFTDNGDGTVTDNLTNLMWLKDANCIETQYPYFDNDGWGPDGAVKWQNALYFVRGINFGSYPKCGAGYNDWRLPNRNELDSLIDHSNSDGMPLPIGHPFINMQFAEYWTSTTAPPEGWWTSYVYIVYMYGGSFGYDWKSDDDYVWPVRGGQATIKPIIAQNPSTGYPGRVFVQ
jgi:Protein of unknown function (DUF1566)